MTNEENKALLNRAIKKMDDLYGADKEWSVAITYGQVLDNRNGDSLEDAERRSDRYAELRDALFRSQGSIISILHLGLSDLINDEENVDPGQAPFFTSLYTDLARTILGE